MTCFHSPTTLADFLAVIEGCAIAAGGPSWQSNALLGLGTVTLIAFAVVGLFVLMRTAR